MATLKVKFSDFELITRSRSVLVINCATLSSLALELLKQLMQPKKAIRLLGISVSGFADPANRPMRPNDLGTKVRLPSCPTSVIELNRQHATQKRLTMA